MHDAQASFELTLSLCCHDGLTAAQDKQADEPGTSYTAACMDKHVL